MKRGFTLIEMLVASLLLGMLVTMLTELFSQSSIAWSAGTAMVTDLDDARYGIAKYQRAADAVLDRNGTTIVSVFKGMAGSDINVRAISVAGGESTSLAIDNPSSWTGIGVAAAQSDGGRAGLGNGKAYLVGVSSRGPDSLPDTWDDITTWPAEEE